MIRIVLWYLYRNTYHIAPYPYRDIPSSFHYTLVKNLSELWFPAYLLFVLQESRNSSIEQNLLQVRFATMYWKLWTSATDLLSGHICVCLCYKAKCWYVGIILKRWWGYMCWTHWGRDMMAATMADDIFRCNFVNKNVLIWIKHWLNSVHMGSIDNKSSLIQVMAWHQTCDKPLPEQMMVQFNDAYMRHPTSMS